MLLKTAATGILVFAAASGQTTDTLAQARRAFDTHKYAEAVRLFELARSHDPACELSFYLGLARYRLHEMEEALVAFQEAAQCNPRLTLAFVAMGDAYDERGNQDEALAAYERALLIEPDNASALLGSARIYTKTKADAKAAAALERLVKQGTADAQVHADLGAAYYTTGNRAGAEKEFAEALRLNPKSAAAMLGQSNLLLRNGEAERAVQLARRVILLAPRAFEPRFILGSAYNSLGQFAPAATQLETAVRLGGSEPEIYYHLARAYGGLGRTEQRAAALAKFAELTRQVKADKEGQRTALGLVEEAKSLVQTGDLAGALTRIEQARDLRPSDPVILFRMASLNYDLAHYDVARDAIQAAVALAPTEWLYRFLQGLIDWRSGRLGSARASLEMAIRLNSSAADAQNALGEVALQQGNIDLAEASFRKASELDPSQALYRENLESARRAAPQ